MCTLSSNAVVPPRKIIALEAFVLMMLSHGVWWINRYRGKQKHDPDFDEVGQPCRFFHVLLFNASAKVRIIICKLCSV